MRCIRVLYTKPFENFIAPHTTEYRYITPFNKLKAINIPVVETKYCINYDEYISRIDDLIEKTQSPFDQELRFVEEKIRNEANQYAKNVADQNQKSSAPRGGV